MKNTFGGFERYVIRDRETGSAYMDSFDTIQECIDRIIEYEKEDKKEGCFKVGRYVVYDILKEDIVDIVMYAFGFPERW